MGEAKRKRREEYLGKRKQRDAIIEDHALKRREATINDEVSMAWSKMCTDSLNGQNSQAVIDGLIAASAPAIKQDDIPANLSVFATMEAAWQDLVDRWFHEGMPDKLKQDGKFIFYHGVQAAANLMMYCEGQDMFGTAADQVQGDCIAYEKEAEAVLAERKAEEWRTGEI